MPDNYWNKTLISRRKALRAAAAASGGIAALSLIGCGGDDDDDGGDDSQSQQVDSTQGKPGGDFIFQAAGNLGNTRISITPSAQNQKIGGGLVHSGLFAFDFGRPPSNGIDAGAEPDLALALPEQSPDQMTFTAKLRSAQFHNGRTVTAEDVKYSLEKIATDPLSTRRTFWAWMDRVEAPDAQTVVIRTKQPFADAVSTMSGYNDGFIVAREFEEGPDVNSKMMGSGPYIWDSNQEGVMTKVRKHPNYYGKPYPYFDTITMLHLQDREKQIADFTAKNVHMTFWQPEDVRDRMKAARPDAKVWSYPYGANAVNMRVDLPPFNDKRVRQALSLGIDQKKVREGVSKGEGELDQAFSLALGPKWGFRKPSALVGAKYREYNPAEAKSLMTAAGITQPIEVTFHQYEAAFGGQAWYDMVTLTAAGWKELGLANVRQNPVPFSVVSSTFQVGNFEGMALQPASMNPTPGAIIRNAFWSPPGGVTVPTPNTAHINNQELSALMDKQLTRFNFQERRQTFTRAEDIMHDELYRIPWSTYSTTYFTDPSVKNVVVPVWGYGGSAHYMKYWWLD